MKELLREEIKTVLLEQDVRTRIRARVVRLIRNYLTLDMSFRGADVDIFINRLADTRSITRWQPIPRDLNITKDCRRTFNFLATNLFGPDLVGTLRHVQGRISNELYDYLNNPANVQTMRSHVSDTLCDRGFWQNVRTDLLKGLYQATIGWWNPLDAITYRGDTLTQLGARGLRNIAQGLHRRYGRGQNPPPPGP